MMGNVERVRRDTAACVGVNHLNNAGSSPMPAPVLAAIVAHLDREAACGAMESAEVARPQLAAVYDSAADLLGCRPGEVALTGSQSRGAQLVLAGVRLQEGDRILTGPSEWGGNYANLDRLAAEAGATLEVIPTDPEGAVDLYALARTLDGRVRLVSVAWCPANGGAVHPVAQIGALLRDSDALFMVDAAQVVGQLPVDVREVGCDVLTASGRKWLRGPRGTGLLYVSANAMTRLRAPLVDVFSAPWTPERGYQPRDDARRYETSERSVALELGLGAAIDYARTIGVEAIARRAGALASVLREGLGSVRGVVVQDPPVGPRSAIVSFSLAGMAAGDVQGSLRAVSINAGAVGPAYAPIDMVRRGLSGLVRLSPHFFNTEDEIHAAISAIGQIAVGAEW
jgi:cysteine desulfurase / selenocysteine lyase